MDWLDFYYQLPAVAEEADAGDGFEGSYKGKVNRKRKLTLVKERVREGGLKRDGQVLDLRQDQVSGEEAQKVIGGLNLSFPAF